MSLFKTTTRKVKVDRSVGLPKVARTAGIPALARLSIAGPISWLSLPSSSSKTGYALPAGPDPRR